ncbi:hypothetical protein GCM10027413_09810 [Conyzicola nivalis]|uniref:Uncharacterized protein n=1 Tax=Conyzicola nivalis TaxID=1477021 RepID=A0A916SJ94_9MICO|nr:hypothetical protein [Conyzicola nivalis]GGB02800.1 hypothetical protein GCM10010979_16810 [Conyzicola nivalis]
MRDFGWGYSGFSHLLGAVLYGVFALISVAVTVALIFFVVRFLIYGTRAAQLYIEKNSPPKPAAAADAPHTREPAAPTPAPAPTQAPAPAPAAPPAPAAAPKAPAEKSDTATTPVLPSTPVVPPADAAPKAAPKATPAITPPATKKPPVKKTPQPPVA